MLVGNENSGTEGWYFNEIIKKHCN